MLLWPLMWAAGCYAGLENSMDLDSMCNSNKYETPHVSIHLSYQILMFLIPDFWLYWFKLCTLTLVTFGTVHRWCCYLHDSWRSWFTSPDLHSRSCSCFLMDATGGTTLFTPKMSWGLEVFNTFFMWYATVYPVAKHIRYFTVLFIYLDLTLFSTKKENSAAK